MHADLRSDTVTRPSAAMLRAMAGASLADDARDGDPTVRTLEAEAAALTGKEAALFVPSGTMGNIAAILARTRPGDRIVVESDVHVYQAEGRGYAVLAGVEPLAIRGATGVPPEAAVRLALERDDQRSIRLLCLETTHNAQGGVVAPLEEMAKIHRAAAARDVPVHLDGARLFNAAVHLGCRVRDISGFADSLVFCLSKGLGAPAGSVLCGSRDFVAAARRAVKRLGGAMRQIGPLAAAGLLALEAPHAQIAADHRAARRLAEAVADLDPRAVDPTRVVTNIVHVDLRDEVDPERFVAALRADGVLVGLRSHRTLRLVTHRDVGDREIDHAIRAIRAAWPQTDQRRAVMPPGAG